jgi:hypothetical protein
MVDVVNKNDWRTEINILRETWGFIHIQTTLHEEEHQTRHGIEAIETGVGNSNRLLRTNRIELDDVEDEKQLLGRLKTYVDTFKQDGQTLVTPDVTTLQTLRTRLLEHEITVSFRGLRHIPLQQVYTEYFTYDSQDVRFDSYQDIDGEIASDKTAVESMWSAYKKAGPYLPQKEARGRKL